MSALQGKSEVRSCRQQSPVVGFVVCEMGCEARVRVVGLMVQYLLLACLWLFSPVRKTFRMY